MPVCPHNFGLDVAFSMLLVVVSEFEVPGFVPYKVTYAHTCCCLGGFQVSCCSKMENAWWNSPCLPPPQNGMFKIFFQDCVEAIGCQQNGTRSSLIWSFMWLLRRTHQHGHSHSAVATWMAKSMRIWPFMWLLLSGSAHADEYDRVQRSLTLSSSHMNGQILVDLAIHVIARQWKASKKAVAFRNAAGVSE